MDYVKWANQQIDRTAEPRGRTAVVVALAERLGMTKGTLYKRLDGTIPFSPTEIVKIAEFFGVESPIRGMHANRAGNVQTIGNVIPLLLPGTRAIDDEWITYPVAGVIEPGSCCDVSMLTHAKRRSVQGEKSTSHPNAKPMAWEINGAVLIGVDFQSSGGALSNNDTVVVERHRAGMVERSVWAVAILPDRTELQPRLTDRIHDPIIYKNGNHEDDTEIRILTVVHGAYNSLRP